MALRLLVHSECKSSAPHRASHPLFTCSHEMRRTTRRALLNLALFVIALLAIIYLNLGATQTRPRYVWTRIRYTSRSRATTSAIGVCPHLTKVGRPALVVATVAADGATDWIDGLKEKYQPCVYSADLAVDLAQEQKDEHQTRLPLLANRGHEAMAYLTFIIDNYDAIPSAAVFVHGSRWAWHNDAPDYDNRALLANLNVSSALEQMGYHNLKCDWSASTCETSGGRHEKSPSQGSLETKMNALLQPWNMRAVADAALSRSFVQLFGDGSSSINGLPVNLARSDTVQAQCCAQFVVSRERILQHSREEYIALRQWLLDADAAPRDDRIAGRILSYLWHILFLPLSASTGGHSVDLAELNKMACPTALECYCRLYGRCDLECGGEGSCEGQYVLPEHYKLPNH